MATKNLFKLTIARVDEPVFKGEAIQVTVPGIEGEMTILANHEALISPLVAGTIHVTKADNTTESHHIDNGTIEIANNTATILI